MTRKLTEALAHDAFERAGGICEYCRISIEDTYLGGEIDHILSLKHGGETQPSNLALACQPCNRRKGTDLGSISAASGILIRFFNPRTDLWSEHFRVNENAAIEPLSEIGDVTARILRFNDLDRLIERKGLIEIGQYHLHD